MSAFDLTLHPLPKASGDLRALTIRTGQAVLTRLVREGANAPDDAARVPATPLAFWVADHWWRLRYECRPLIGFPSAWRQAHELPAIGAGYAWPRVTIWGEGSRIIVVSKSDPPGVAGPVRFLTDALAFVPAPEFEGAVDGLLGAAMQVAEGKDSAALAALIEALDAERADPEIAAWRRMEAIAGYDPDQAPNRLMEGLQQLADRYSASDVEEAAASQPGDATAETLLAVIQAASSAGIDTRFRDVIAGLRTGGLETSGPRGTAQDHSEPWQMAERAAAALRQHLDAPIRPLRNKDLAALAGVPARELQTAPSPDHALPYGLRTAAPNGAGRVLLQARWGHDRRFELMRALGDAIWTGNSLLGPISRAGTARQKFQRAFAASLLCPPTALQDYLQTEEPADEDISEAARHFHVAERVVQTILVNKRLMARGRLSTINLTMNSQPGSTPLPDLADAA